MERKNISLFYVKNHNTLFLYTFIKKSIFIVLLPEEEKETFDQIELEISVRLKSSLIKLSVNIIHPYARFNQASASVIMFKKDT